MVPFGVPMSIEAYTGVYWEWKMEPTVLLRVVKNCGSYDNMATKSRPYLRLSLGTRTVLNAGNSLPGFGFYGLRV